MKKTLVFLAVLLLLANAPSFADDSEEMTICIQGFGSKADHVTFFRDAFMAEAEAAGFKVTDQFDFKYADYGIRFDITPNPNINEQQYIFTISLVRIKDLAIMVTATYSFTELEEMSPYTQYLFFRLVANIPGYRTGGLNAAWKNKWLYLRLSVDYPITIYGLQPNGLINGVGVYRGDFGSPDDTMPLDNKTIALPGATLGIEVQFLNWMSLEANAKASLEELFGEYHISLAGEVELKFPIKTNYFMIEPYLAASYPIFVPDRFVEFPLFAFGGGVQVSVRGGSYGAFFVDINYMHTLSDAVAKNPYGGLFPNPEKIHYRRYVIGLGVGYKFGLFSRK